MDNLNSALPQDPIYAIALATGANIGSDFLTSLVRALHDVMPVSLAFIARSSGDPAEHASATTSWRDGEVGFPVEYDLEGTPCKLLYGGKTLVVPADLMNLFPEKETYESYCGVPLPLRGGRIGGHFAVFSSDVITNPQKVEGIMRIFGMRAATELQRLEDDAEREVMIARLNDQRLALHNANTFKSSAIGMVAHDLRNPLATIVSRTELVEALVAKTLPTQSDKIGKSLAMVLKSTDRMNGMINNLLDAARLELDSIQITKNQIRLSTPVTAAIDIVRAQANAKSIAIDVESGSDGAIMADEARLIEVMVNLLTNAVKYSPQDTRIMVSFAFDPNTQTASITVKDTGLGMTQADMDRAFQPFQILSAKPTGGEGSTGLGLVIVRSVIEAHGGAVTVHSDGQGHGTEFRILLPQEQRSV